MITNAIDVNQVSYRYGRVTALRDATFLVPEGALYALLGPNGSGKTTLLQILMGLRRPQSGHASVVGIDSTTLTAHDRGRIGYVAEGQALPGWMRLSQLEAYLAPLYDTWDASLARSLRERFGLDPSRKIRAMSRGEQMKAALLCALAPRPKLLVMDEPFTGMDALVKDELVRGLLAASGDEGWTVLVCSHDIGELELLADWVGLLDRGSMRLSEPMERVREEFKRVDATLPPERVTGITDVLPPDWMCAEVAGRHLSFVVRHRSSTPLEVEIIARLGPGSQLDVRDATLREVFVALARTDASNEPHKVSMEDAA